MILLLYAIVFAIINVGLICFAKHLERTYCTYETMFCRDVRAQMGLFSYRSKVEEKREQLNRPNSKF